MDRRDAYHGQVVTEGDVDEWFNDVEDAEEQLAMDTAIRQATLAESPSSANYGGILAGLTVSGTPGADYVTVTLGSARDDDGSHIKLTGPATVKLSHTGLTAIAEDTDAVGVATAIAGGVCGPASDVVVSLFVCAARNLQDAKTDAGGVTVNYDQLESFRFYLGVGSADFTHAGVIAGTETPTRAALADGYVLLADIIATNSGGTMVVRAVMNTETAWRSTYSPPGNYASLSGRRADWLAVAHTNDFSAADAAEDVLRANTAREALYDLSRRVRCEAFSAYRPEAASVLFRKRGRFGHPAIPNEFFDNMHYASVPDLTTGHLGDHWTISAEGGGALGVGTNDVLVGVPGVILGYALLGTHTTINQGVQLRGGYVANSSVAPYSIAMLRFAVGSLSDTSFMFGIRSSTTTLNSCAYAVLNTAGTGAIIASVVNSVGVPGATVTLGTVVANTPATLRIAITANNAAWFQLNTGAWVKATTVGGTTMASVATYSPVITLANLLEGGRRYAYVYQAYAADGQLSADLIP